MNTLFASPCPAVIDIGIDNAERIAIAEGVSRVLADTCVPIEAGVMS
jgi:hypothetical protein